MFKRLLRFHDSSPSQLGLTLPITKVVSVDIPKRCVLIEEMKDGTFRLTYSKSLEVNEELPDLTIS
jgi:hypothetical protein